MDDDVIDLLTLKSPLVLGGKRIEDEKATIMLAGQVVYAAKQLSREVQSILHPLTPWIKLNRKVALLILWVFAAKDKCTSGECERKIWIIVVPVVRVPVGDKRALRVCERLVRFGKIALPPPI